MGAEGPGILQHDLAQDVVDLFFEQFDRQTPPAQIAADLQDQLGFAELDDAEKEVFAAGMLECFWQTGTPTAEYEQLLRGLREAEGVRDYWGDHLPQRRRAIDRLLIKLQTPKAKPRRPKVVRASSARKPPKRLFEIGDYVAYQRNNGSYVPLILTDCAQLVGLCYFFAMPHLPNPVDEDVLRRFVQTQAALSDEEFLLFVRGQKKCLRGAALAAKHLKQNLPRFLRFGNRPLKLNPEQLGGISLAYSFEDFESKVIGNGSRPFTDAEWQLVLGEQERLAKTRS